MTVLEREREREREKEREREGEKAGEGGRERKNLLLVQRIDFELLRASVLTSL